MVQFHALGGVAVTDDGREINVGGPRQRRLLAMLLIHRNSVVSVDRLADAVFAGEPTAAASTTMRSYIARIRKVVSADGSGPTVVTQAPGYVLRVPDEAFDVARFEQGVSDGRSLLSRGDAAEAATVLRGALALWNGDPYAEFDDEEWVRPEAQRLAELRLVAAELRFDAELAAGRAAETIPDLESMVGLHPLREAFVTQLMTALYRAGRQADALRAYQRHREVLIEELGLDPTPALQELEDRILAHDPELLGAGTGSESLRGYRLGERLGTGYRGTVFAAHLPGVDRDLAIRVLRPEIADSPDFVRSFEARAHRIGSMRHSAIVPIHDYWREPGAAYVVMRRMHGGSLADRLERIDRRPFSVPELTELVQRIGAALAATHEAGLVHGRVDPHSVLFDEEGNAWLSDFDLGSPDRSPAGDVGGLARLIGSCVVDPTPAAMAAIQRGLDELDRPSIDEYVGLVVDALTGASVADAAPVPNPYKGLRAFDEADAADFFGRTDLVDGLVRRLGRSELGGRLVLVVGGSGTGKSSVVRAGLLPRLRGGAVPGSEHWFVTTMLPGATPFKELAAALRRVAITDADDMVEHLARPGGIHATIRRLLPSDEQLLLVVDQFEELFTSAPEAVQRQFLDGVMDAVTNPDSRLRLVGTLRADFYDRPLAFQPFGGAVNAATVTVPAMSPAELEAAIVEPAQRVGRQVDRALVAELVSAAAHEPAGLPALQFTLFELAERCPGDLTLDAYRGLGGLSGAISARAEALYRSLDDDERATVRRLFHQLVVVNPDGEPTRRRATRIEIAAADPAADPVIDRWVDARLLSLDRHRQSRLPTVEPAHEALLREWPRLRRWIEEDREALLVLGGLRESAAGWLELDRDPGALYRGARLQVALDTLGAAALTPIEREFLDVSEAARAADLREAEDRLERTAKANRRLRRQLVVIGAALVVALVGGFVALDQRQDAERERRIAFVRELTAAADANLGEDPERAMLLALEAVAASDASESTARAEAIGALHDALSTSRALLTVPGLGGSTDWSPDGSVFVTEGPEETGLIDLRDPTTGESVRSWTGHEVDVNEVAFSHDGELLATGGDDGYLRVWETATGDEVAELRGDGGEVASAMSFSPDGRLVVGTWMDRSETRVFDVRSGEMLLEIGMPQVHGAHFSPDGAQIALASLEVDGVVVVDSRTAEQVHHVGKGTDHARDARFSPDGRWLASAHGDGLVRVWDAATGELRFTVTGHTAEATSVAWSPDSARLATAGSDGTARVHDLIDGGARETVVVSGRDTANGIAVVDFSPDGNRIVTGDMATTAVQVWDVRPTAGGEWATVPGVPSAPGSGSPAFLRDGRVLLATDAQGGVTLWDPDSAERRGRLDLGVAAGEPIRVAVSPDGSTLASGHDDGVRLWDLDTGEQIADVEATDGSFVIDLAWAPDGEHLAVTHDAMGVPKATVVDRRGVVVAEAVEDGDEPVFIVSVAFVGDGDTVAITRFPARPTPDHAGLRVWDWRRDEVALEVKGRAGDVAADPTGPRVVVTEELTGKAHIYDVEAGKRLRTLRGAGAAFSVTYSADGSRVAMSAADGAVRVFDASDGRLELILRGHDRAISSTAFSPDGTQLASLDEGGEVRVWALDVDELVEIARRRATRALDDAECRQYLRRRSCTGT